MGVFKEIPKEDGTITTFYRISDDKATVESSSNSTAIMDYNNNINKPSINSIVLTGNKTAEDLGLQPAGEYLTNIPDTYIQLEQLGRGFVIDEDGIITTTADFDNVVEVMTGEDLSNVDDNYNGTVLCTSDYNKVKKGSIYVVEKGRITATIIQASSGGGVVVNTNNTVTISPLEQNVPLNTEVILYYDYKSTTNGKGVAKLYYNNALRSTKTISIGENSFDVSQYIKEGINNFSIEVTDSNNFSIILDYIVNGVNLTLKSNFNANMVYSSNIDFRYTAIGYGVKTVYFKIDGVEVGRQEVKGTGEENSYTLTNLHHGTQRLTVYCTTEIGDVLIESNVLSYNILYAESGNMTPIVASNFNTKECFQGELLNIDYIIYDPSTDLAQGQLQINDEDPIEILVDRTLHYWSVSNYPLGDVIFKISCGDVSLSIPITVKELEIDLEPVTDGLELYLSAANRSNAELKETREKWEYGDITTTFNNVNWVSNGWVDGALKLTGEANAVINYNIFDTDIRTTGKTIEFDFETHNVSNLDSVLISCWSDSKGIKITSTECIYATELETVKTRFKENEKIRVAITIENLNSNRLIKTYVNGILSGVIQYNTQDNLQQTTPVGITINEDGEEIDVRSIRIYNNALTSRGLLNNYMYDIQDINEKIIKYNSNNIYDMYGDVAYAKIKSMIPILTITGDLPGSKGDKKIVSTYYNDPFTPINNFSYTNCEIDVQGTSSQYYPRKNYKIKFPEKFSFYNGAIPENIYTFKADYMESSHMYNTGNAVFINMLYEQMFPTQTESNGVRNTIYGFPCVIFYRADDNADYEYIGVYNFNNDKDSSDTLGLTTTTAESWEFCNNTSGHCLLRDDNFGPDSGVENDFQARYPKEYKDNPDYTALQRVVSWIVSTENDLDKFKSEFDQYFNLYYCLIYYVMMEFGLMMDSRAKNMFFDTVDGIIWYPRFYDMDTCFGLNNEGVLGFGYGLEQHDENIYNGENSLFWNNFEECYSTEIKNMYLSLRASGKISYDKVMEVYEEHQRQPISEANYNEDANYKYLSPLLENDDSTYIYTAQGDRLSHFKWWVSNRLNYLDSKFDAPDFTKDFITMRLYTDNGNFYITPYIDMYLKGKFGSADNKVRAKAGESTELDAPAGLQFNDTETIIYGGSNISSLGDLSNKYAGTVDISKASKLKDLIIGNQDSSYSNPNLKTLSLGNNNLLTKIDISNCPNLVGNLDVSKCKKLKEVWAEGSGITGLSFVDGGDLSELHLPTTITNLTIKNHINLHDISPVNFDNLQTLVLKNSRLNATELLFNNFNNINRLYCNFDEESNTTFNTYIMDILLENCGGIDDNDLNIPYPNIQGYINMTYPSTISSSYLDELKEKYATYFPYLTINYVSEPVYYSYNSSTKKISVTASTLPSIISVPNLKDVHKYLNIDKLDENTGFSFISNGTESSKDVVTTLIIPSGYSSYYLNLQFFQNLDKIIFPKDEDINITYLVLGKHSYNNSKIGMSLKSIDLSADNIRLNNLNSQSSFMIGSIPTLEKIDISNKEIGGYYFYLLNNNYDSMIKIKEINLNNLYLPICQSFSIVSSSSYTIGKDGSILYINNLSAPILTSLSFRYLKGIESIYMNNINIPKLISLEEMFHYCSNLKYIYWEGLDTSKITNMSNMFGSCNKIENLDLSIFNTSSVTNMSNMFSNCSSLPELNLSNFDTSKVIHMYNMFSGCSSLTKLDLSNFNTSNVTSMSGIFKDCSSLTTLNLSSFNTSNVTNMSYMFYGCSSLPELDLSNFNIDKTTTTAYMFTGCSNLQTLNFDLSNNIITDMSYMFHGCTNLVIDTSLIDTSHAKTLSYMFAYCYKLTEVDLSIFCKPSVTNISYGLYYCTGLKKLDFTGLDFSNITSSSYFLSGLTGIEEIIIDNANVSKIGGDILNLLANNHNIEEFDTSLSNFGTYTHDGYYNMNLLYGATALKRLDLSGFEKISLSYSSGNFLKDSPIEYLNMGNTYLRQYNGGGSMSNLFMNKKTLKELDISNIVFDTMTSMYNGFNGCTNLTVIHFPKDVHKITTFGYLFNGCSSLKTLNLPEWDTTSLTNMSYMFANCTSLTTVSIPASWDTKLVTTFSYMFKNCRALTSVNINNLNTSKVTDISYMFDECSSLENLDLSNLTFSAITSASYVFRNCFNLKTLDLSGMTLSKNMSFIYFFYDCHSLEKLDIRNWNIAAITSSNYYSNMFSYVPYNCQIIVKNEACRTWLKQRRNDFTNIVLPSEL